MKKIIIAFLGFILVSILIAAPFISILYGFYSAYCGKLISALLYTCGGLLYLYLVKPISILMDKDYKIF